MDLNMFTNNRFYIEILYTNRPVNSQRAALPGLSTDREIIRKNPADRGANVVGCNWVVKIVNGK